MTEAGFSVNFTGTKEPKSESLPGGTYPLRVYKLEFGKNGPTSKDPGAVNLKAEFRIAQGEHEGRPLFRTFTFSDQSKPYFLAFCRATGKFTEDELTGKADIKAQKILSLQNTIVAADIRRKADREFGFDDGFKNEIRRFYSIKSDEGKKALAAINRDPLAPGNS